MTTRIIMATVAGAAAAGAAAFALSGAASAESAEEKAEAVCTGAADISDYRRWRLLTDTCADGAEICTIALKDDSRRIEHACPIPDEGDDGDGGGTGAGSPKPKPPLQD